VYLVSTRSPPAGPQADSQTSLILQSDPLNKYGRIEVLIRSPVRSHPVLVLPATGGRSSLGFFVPIQVILSRPKVDVRNRPNQQSISFRVSGYLNGSFNLLPGINTPLMTSIYLEAFKW
jgi:hypothetical protein